jgi:preprotein translocase subunit SecF
MQTLELGEVQIQQFGTPTDVLIRVAEAADAASTERDLSAVDAMRQDLEGEFEIRRVEIVGPQVSRELIQTGLLAVVGAIGSMLIYIWFRFEWQFSVGAVMALVHDVILTIGVFSLLQLDFNLSILAAILTIVGYSMNDTVVVYDRVRENLRKYKKMDISELLDIAINQTLSRTVMTSVTTLLALIALYTLGGEVIRGFTFAMIWGVIVGTYSSIFIAAPLLILLSVKRDWSEVQSN